MVHINEVNTQANPIYVNFRSTVDCGKVEIYLFNNMNTIIHSYIFNLFHFHHPSILVVEMIIYKKYVLHRYHTYFFRFIDSQFN